MVIVDIEDNGPGIHEEFQQKVFDPFITTKPLGKGTGLGLFIVRQIVERNGGRIAVESTVGQGTVFTLTFPAAQGAAVAA